MHKCYVLLIKCRRILGRQVKKKFYKGQGIEKVAQGTELYILM